MSAKMGRLPADAGKLRELVGNAALRHGLRTASTPALLDELPPPILVELAYWMALDRAPSSDELAQALDELAMGTIDRQALLARLRGDFTRLPHETVARLGYQVVLGREADEVGRSTVIQQLDSGTLDRHGVIDWLRGSGEFANLGFRHLLPSLHASRCRFIRTLPRSARILDLGGTDLGNPVGAMVSMGWPYQFEELVVIDLPPDERHELYFSAENDRVVQTHRGPVRYEYHSMVDLSRYETDSFDLVYSGQTFEHVTEADGEAVLEQVRRVLRPGGCFALDTPNAAVCRLQQDELIDPDHKIEYTGPELAAKLEIAGFEITGRWGLVLGGDPVLAGRFSAEEAARNDGIFADQEHCYLLAFTAVSP